MGYKYEVSAWISEHGIGYGDYTYQTVYAGDSLIKAIIAMIKIKIKKTSGCVKLEWR